MPYSEGFRPDEYDEYRDYLRVLGQNLGTFDANDALVQIAGNRAMKLGPDVPLGSTGDILTVLKDMEDLGYIRAVEPGAKGVHRWEYIEGE